MKIHSLDITINRKAIKHVYIRVRSPDGAVEVSAPKHMSERLIRAAINERFEWIKQQQKSIASAPISAPIEFISGETHFLWGTPYTLNVIETSGKPRVQISSNILRLYAPAGATLEQKGKTLDEFYKQEIKAQVSVLLPLWESTMGVQSKEWRIRKMKTRWGSCNTQAKRIWLNLELAKKPRQCLEYVLVHELVHLLERGHNARFYGFMDQFLPDWRLQEQQLNQRH